MIRFLHLAHAILAGVFATITADLDAPQHARRLAASKSLMRSYPWSVPACLDVIERSESTEAVQRAEDSLARYRSFRDAIEWDLRIWSLVAEPAEHNGLPWLPWERYGPLAGQFGAKAALARRVAVLREAGHFKGATFCCEEAPGCCWGIGWGGFMTGFNEVRFAARGLPWPWDNGINRRPPPEWIVRRGWAMAQGQRSRGAAMTLVERIFAEVVRLHPDMPDRIVLARLATATLLLPFVVPVKLWRSLSWTKPS